MAVYRKINLSFWEDTKIVDEFTPEDRYFMLYLMTKRRYPTALLPQVQKGLRSVPL